MIIALVGPHAVGKSTAANRWFERYGRLGLNVVHCDNSEMLSLNSTQRCSGWSGSTTQKQELARACAESREVFLLEGNTARSTPWLKVVPVVEAIHVTCRWQRFKELMQTRCASKGKKFREDYWKERQLVYESKTRFLNCISNKPDVHFSEFIIEDQLNDWPAVDAHFGRLFRRLHNQLVRSR